jgi:hypothetical protein
MARREIAGFTATRGHDGTIRPNAVSFMDARAVPVPNATETALRYWRPMPSSCRSSGRVLGGSRVECRVFDS